MPMPDAWKYLHDNIETIRYKINNGLMTKVRAIQNFREMFDENGKRHPHVPDRFINITDNPSTRGNLSLFDAHRLVNYATEIKSTDYYIRNPTRGNGDSYN